METKREWTTIKEYEEILFDFYNGIARITINRERYRNAFTPTTTTEMSDALYICRERPDINVVVLTGAGDTAFCAGGDMHVKGHGGYIGKDGVARLNVLDVQKQIRSIPKPVIAAVNGFAIGGGHVLHVVCDLTIASENAIFGQTGPRVGSFDAGFGSSYLARIVGQKKAREIWFLCRKYNAQEALDMGLVNKVVPLDKLEDEYVGWAEEMMLLSPLALRMIKAGLNAELDGQAGIQELAGDATMQIQNLNALVDTVRHEIIERYRPGEDDPHLKVLQAAHISDDEYFSQMVRDDLNLIIRDIREAHKKDSESAPQTTVANELKENLEAVENFKGSRDEKLVILYCKQLGINYKNLSEEEFRWFIRILKKSKKMGTPISQRKKR